MNKKFLAAAVGAMLVATPVLIAQADTTLYGHASVSVDYLNRDNRGNSEDEGKWFVSSNQSRVGIRANEDLGDGWKALAQAEFAINMDTAGTASVCTNVGCTSPSNVSTFSNRNIFVGLESGFGTVRLGHIDTTIKEVGAIADLFYREQLGEDRAITNGSLVDNFFDARVTNSVNYTSPDFSGITAKLQMGVEDSFGTDNKIMGANARWTAGPLNLGLGWQKRDTTRSATSTEDTSGYRLAARHTLDPITVAVLWQTVKNLSGIDGADRDTFGLGLSFQMGNNVIKTQWYRAGERDDVDDSGADQISLGFDHLFSKTTKGYVAIARTSNDDAGTFSVGGDGHGAVATPGMGGDATGVSIGMAMDF